MKLVGKASRFDAPRNARLDIAAPPSGIPVVLVRRSAIREMYEHASSEMHHEVGGYFLGLPLVDTERGIRATYIETAVRARYSSNPVRVTMHPESFNDVDALSEKTDTTLVGYYHSHPRLSVFQSGTDVKNFQDYHSEPYQIAVVVDPSLTTSDSILETSEWIGYFGWDDEQMPARLPAHAIILVDERPIEARDTDDLERAKDLDENEEIERPASDADSPASPTVDSTTRVEATARDDAEMASHIERAIRERRTSLSVELPLLLLGESVGRELEQAQSTMRGGCILLGFAGKVEDFTFVALTGFAAPADRHPSLPEGRLARFKARIATSFGRRHSDAELAATHDAEPVAVGFCVPSSYYERSCTATPEYGVIEHEVLRWPNGVAEGFLTPIDPLCVVGLIDADSPDSSLRFRFWHQIKRRLVDVPASHLVLG